VRRRPEEQESEGCPASFHLPERCEIGQSCGDKGRFQFEIALIGPARQSEGEIIVGIGRAGSGQQIAGCGEPGRRCDEFGKPGEYGIGISERVETTVGRLGIQKTAADGGDLGEERSDGEGIEAALKFGTALEDWFTAIARRLAGFVVGDAGDGAGPREIEAINASANGQVRTRDNDRR
jgi:hypothetical protein